MILELKFTEPEVASCCNLKFLLYLTYDEDHIILKRWAPKDERLCPLIISIRNKSKYLLQKQPTYMFYSDSC